MQRIPSSVAMTAVLVVDDESSLRFSAMDVLEAAGFEVLEAENADVAIDVLAQRKDVQILLTDINMPGSMDGVGLAHFAQIHWPLMAIVVTSGAVKPEELSLPERIAFLAKPYQPGELLDTIQQVCI